MKRAFTSLTSGKGEKMYTRDCNHGETDDRVDACCSYPKLQGHLGCAPVVLKSVPLFGHKYFCDRAHTMESCAVFFGSKSTI